MMTSPRLRGPATIPTPRSIRLVRVPATARMVSASSPREKCTAQAEPNPSASARTTCSTTSPGAIRLPMTSSPTPAAIRMLTCPPAPK
jgi:hypothetical protein